MDQSCTDERIRELVSQVLEGDFKARGLLVGALLPVMDATALKAIHSHGYSKRRFPEEFKLEVVNEFLETRMGDMSYLRSLVAAPTPVGFVCLTITNLVIDHGRNPDDAVSATAQGTQEEGDQPLDMVERAEDKSPDSEAEMLRQQRKLLLKALILEMKMKDRLLLFVVEAEHCELSLEQKAWLADFRGVSPEQVSEEFRRRREARIIRHQEVDEEAERISEHYSKRISGAKRTIYMMRRLIEELDGVAVPPPGPLTAERREELRSSNQALKEAQPWERAAYLDFMDNLLAQYGNKARKVTARKGAELPQKGWAEVAVIMGEVTPSTSEDERPRIENKLTSRYRWLRKRLMASDEA